MKTWIVNHIGIVRLRQLVEETRHRLAFVPLVMTFVAVVASQVTLLIDRQIGNDGLTGPLATTVESSRVLLATIAGGLITAFTLLVSMMLVAVQLASGQFSPRTLRNWLSDAMLQRSIGLVLATTVFCLMGLRSARELGDDAIVPNVTAIVAVLLGVASLVAVVRAVDHVTTNLQIGTVAQQITDDTVGVVEAVDGDRQAEGPRVAPAPQRPGSEQRVDRRRPSTAIVVESTHAGWVQQIDTAALADALPPGSTAWVEVIHGAYVTSHSPLARIDIGRSDDDDGSGTTGDASNSADRSADELAEHVRDAFALGESRTMQRDIGFGVAQLADIAVRALSPGVNDPQTAQDVIRHLAEVMLALWTHPAAPAVTDESGRTIHHNDAGHRDHLRAGFDPVRRYGRSDPAVMLTMARTLVGIRSEVERRDLPGPTEPIDELIAEVAAGADDDSWLPRERDELREATGATTFGSS